MLARSGRDVLEDVSGDRRVKGRPAVALPLRGVLDARLAHRLVALRDEAVADPDEQVRLCAQHRHGSEAPHAHRSGAGVHVDELTIVLLDDVARRLDVGSEGTCKIGEREGLFGLAAARVEE